MAALKRSSNFKGDREFELQGLTTDFKGRPMLCNFPKNFLEQEVVCNQKVMPSSEVLQISTDQIKQSQRSDIGKENKSMINNIGQEKQMVKQPKITVTMINKAAEIASQVQISQISQHSARNNQKAAGSQSARFNKQASQRNDFISQAPVSLDSCGDEVNHRQDELDHALANIDADTKLAHLLELDNKFDTKNLENFKNMKQQGENNLKTNKNSGQANDNMKVLPGVKLKEGENVKSGGEFCSPNQRYNAKDLVSSNETPPSGTFNLTVGGKRIKRNSSTYNTNNVPSEDQHLNLNDRKYHHRGGFGNQGNSPQLFNDRKKFNQTEGRFSSDNFAQVISPVESGAGGMLSNNNFKKTSFKRMPRNRSAATGLSHNVGRSEQNQRFDRNQQQCLSQLIGTTNDRIMSTDFSQVELVCDQNTQKSFFNMKMIKANNPRNITNFSATQRPHTSNNFTRTQARALSQPPQINSNQAKPNQKSCRNLASSSSIGSNLFKVMSQNKKQFLNAINYDKHAGEADKIHQSKSIRPTTGQQQKTADNKKSEQQLCRPWTALSSNVNKTESTKQSAVHKNRLQKLGQIATAGV